MPEGRQERLAGYGADRETVIGIGLPATEGGHRGPMVNQQTGELHMRRFGMAMLASAALAVSGGAVLAHHSFAMFDQEHPMELKGTVTEFKFTSPHTFVLLSVKGTDGSSTV